jgi:hypothetical protein
MQPPASAVPGSVRAVDERPGRALKRAGRIGVLLALFAACYLLALGIQQTVNLLVAKQLGGEHVRIQVGSGPVVEEFHVRGRPVELRAHWWVEPRIQWEHGIGPRRAFLAGAAGIAVNLLLALVAALDLRHRYSRGLWITALSHLAAAATALLWAAL